jgi:[ribosomal protein S5]-alanine N-acetyltransferase
VTDTPNAFDIPIPTLTTARLVLRPYELADAARLQQLAGDRAIADTTLNMPHPYEDGMAETFIGKREKEWREGKDLSFAVTLPGAGLIGGAGLMNFSVRHRHAEIGYWIGREFWGRGYCTEAAAAVVRFGFERLDLNRIFAWHMTRNPASGRVMLKLGMTHEGRMRRHVERWGKFEDLEFYGLLREEWTAGQS